MGKVMTIVNSEIPAPKKKGGKIVLIETQPEADWFVPVTTKRGRKVWYLRFRMSGWNPRLWSIQVETAMSSFSRRCDWIHPRR
jgi:hypothetical protein